jgi:hypothetical protein
MVRHEFAAPGVSNVLDASLAITATMLKMMTQFVIEGGSKEQISDQRDAAYKRRHVIDQAIQEDLYPGGLPRLTRMVESAGIASVALAISPPNPSATLMPWLSDPAGKRYSPKSNEELGWNSTHQPDDRALGIAKRVVPHEFRDHFERLHAL